MQDASLARGMDASAQRGLAPKKILQPHSASSHRSLHSPNMPRLELLVPRRVTATCMAQSRSFCLDWSLSLECAFFFCSLYISVMYSLSFSSAFVKTYYCFS